MTETKQFDLAVIGSGPGGYVAAIRGAQLGLTVALIEKEAVGGVCLNRGCIPSKAIIHAADLAYEVKSASKIGVIAKDVTVDFPKVIAWKDRVVKKLTMGIAALVKGNGGEIINGAAAFESSNRIKVTGEDVDYLIEAKKVIIATGAKSVEIPPLPFDGQTVISSREALSLDAIPQSMIVVGGGVIGMELGQAYAKLGTQVTVVEMLDQILPTVPEDLAAPLLKKLRRLKIKLHTGARAGNVKVEDGIAKLSVTLSDGTETVLEAEKVLVTIGRRPNTTGLGLENTKVETDKRGFITVDAKRRTTDPSIFAIGDVAGEPQLAHKASAEGLVAAAVAAGQDASFENMMIPAVVYTDPEIASVGLSEEQATKAGHEVLVGEYPFAGHGRAATMDRLDGFIRIVADEKDHRVLGVHIVGASAGDLIGEGALAVQKGLKIEDIAHLIHPHPTMSEAFSEAAEDALGRAIHLMKKA